MPLHIFSAAEAVSTRKANRLADWGNRTQFNRVEPITKPGFEVPFKLEPDEAIFTSGSCFARHIENFLMRAGYRVPMRELFSAPPFSSMNPDIINNYGAPSLANDLAWALDPETPFDFENHILEVTKGRFADLHLSPTMRPQPKEAVRAQRDAITKATQAVRDCRVIIMTLGISEVWFDTQTQTYINEAVRPSFLRDQPKRFELHVLSFEDVLMQMRRAMLLIRKHGHPDSRVILTVSPVPLTVTHRPMDVIVANSYSKSVLRSVVEAVTKEFSFASYYPSYESVMLSDRKMTWLDDFRHVSDALIGVNVSRMISALTGAGEHLSSVKSDIEIGGVVAATAWAEKATAMPELDAKAFFDEYGYWAESSPDFALQFAKYLADGGEKTQALAVVKKATSLTEPLAVLGAEVAFDLSMPDAAYKILHGMIRPGVRSHNLWRLFVKANLQLNGVPAAVAVAQDYVGSTSGQEATTFFYLGDVFEPADAGIAASYFRTSHDLNPEGITAVRLAECLIKSNEHHSAHAILLTVLDSSESMKRRKDRALALVAPFVS